MMQRLKARKYWEQHRNDEKPAKKAKPAPAKKAKPAPAKKAKPAPAKKKPKPLTGKAKIDARLAKKNAPLPAAPEAPDADQESGSTPFD